MALREPGGVRQRIKEILKCPLCFEKSMRKDPRSLPCQHWFCSPCLTKHIRSSVKNDKIACPTCRKEIKMHNITKVAHEFPVAYIINNLNEIMAEHYQASPVDKCTEHEETQHLFCETCKLALCVFCVLDHGGHSKTTLEYAKKKNKQQLIQIQHQIGPLVKKYQKAMCHVSKTSKHAKPLSSTLRKLQHVKEEIQRKIVKNSIFHIVEVEPYEKHLSTAALEVSIFATLILTVH